MNKNIAVLYTTVATEQEAEQLASLAISAKLAACVNILPGGKSIYFWEDKIEKNNECYMLFKTTIELMHELEQFIIRKHPYDVPAILKFNPKASKEFSRFISNSTQD